MLLGLLARASPFFRSLFSPRGMLFVTPAEYTESCHGKSRGLASIIDTKGVQGIFITQQLTGSR
jgi:hypothetical protein